MNSFVVRALVALLLAALLWAQARAARDQRHRRHAFEFAAAALLAFAAYNGALAAGVAFGALQLLVVAVGVGLLVAALVSFVLSVRSGEIRDRRERIAAAAREYRERREQQERREDR